MNERESMLAESLLSLNEKAKAPFYTERDLDSIDLRFRERTLDSGRGANNPQFALHDQQFCKQLSCQRFLRELCGYRYLILKYFASGWCTTIAFVLCSGSSENSSVR